MKITGLGYNITQGGIANLHGGACIIHGTYSMTYGKKKRKGLYFKLIDEKHQSNNNYVQERKRVERKTKRRNVLLSQGAMQYASYCTHSNADLLCTLYRIAAEQ